MRKLVKWFAMSVALCVMTEVATCTVYAEGTGWQYVNNGWYYMSPETQTYSTGWIKDDDKWYYLDPDTGIMQTGWKLL